MMFAIQPFLPIVVPLIVVLAIGMIGSRFRIDATASASQK
jgi:hypothetical protein